LSDPALECLREAGRKAAAARDLGVRQMVPGARIREVCEAVEQEIERLGGGIAFPVQSSRNHVAAHYCSSPEDDTVYRAGDLAKLDIGVHVDGHVVDTAVTVNVGDRPENRSLVEAARQALEAGIACAGPEVPIRRVSAAIEGRIRSLGFRPLHNLCGHGVGRYTVHCAPPIPNLVLSGDDGTRLVRGATVALEPFATDGEGFVAEQGPAEVFRLDPLCDDGDQAGPVLAAIRAFRGLPFARRQLRDFPRGAVETALADLRRRGSLTAYAPLVETQGRPVAQAEHTLRVHDGGVEVLTR
jgi:methionyl aminopeptidase